MWLTARALFHLVSAVLALLVANMSTCLWLVLLASPQFPKTIPSTLGRRGAWPVCYRFCSMMTAEQVLELPTRMMLDYFRSIGFPCPELENLLKFYCGYKLVRAKWVRPAEQLRQATIFGNWSERRACDQRSNLGRPLFWYWSERSACAALGCWHKRRWPLFLVN